MMASEADLDDFYVRLHDVSIPCASNYWATVTLQLDEDLENGNVLDSPTYRSDEFQTGIPGSAPPDTIELVAKFTFPKGAIKDLGVRDPRLYFEVIAVSPGDGAMSLLASDVYPVQIDTLTGTIVTKSELRLFSGNFRNKQVQPGRYRIEISADRPERQNGQTPSVGRHSAQSLPTHIEEGDEASPSPPPMPMPMPGSAVLRPGGGANDRRWQLEANILALTDLGPRASRQPFGIEVHVRARGRTTPTTLAKTAPARLGAAGVQWHQYLNAECSNDDVAGVDVTGFEVFSVTPPALGLPGATALSKRPVLESLGWFPVTLQYLQLYTQYSLELVDSSQADKATGASGPRLYVTLRLRDASAGKFTMQEPMLQVRLDDMQLGAATGNRYWVVGTLVSDLGQASRKLSHGETAHDRSNQRWVVSLPGCKESDFTVAKFGGLRGRSSTAPQIISAGDQAFFHGMYFLAKIYSIFTPKSGLVFEFYEAPDHAVGGNSLSFAWLPPKENLVGWGTVNLNEQLKSTLIAGNRHVAQLRLTLPTAPAGSAGGTPGATSPKVQPSKLEAKLRLTLMMPMESMLDRHHTLPSVPAHTRGTDSNVDGHFADGGFTGPTLKLTLPDGLVSLPNTLDPRKRGDASPRGGAAGLSPPRAGAVGAPYGLGSGGRSPQPLAFQMVAEDPELVAVLQRNNDERVATVRTVVDDYVRTRESIARLTSAGQQLASQLAAHDEAAKYSIERENLDEVPRTSLIQAYQDASLRHELESNRVIDYKKRVQQLQNELITRNDAEKEHLKLEERHLKTCALVQQLQDKARKAAQYEAISRQQHEVIKRLEVLISESPGKIIDPDTRVNSMTYGVLVGRNLELRQALRSARKKAMSQNDGRSQLRKYLGQDVAARKVAPADPALVAAWMRAKERKAKLKEANMLAKAATEVKSDQSFHDKMHENAANERIEGLRRQIKLSQQLHQGECGKLRAAITANSRPAATTPAAMPTREKSIELPRTPGPGAVRPPLTSKAIDRPMSARTLQLQEEVRRRLAKRGAGPARPGAGAPFGTAGSRGPAAMPPF